MTGAEEYTPKVLEGLRVAAGFLDGNDIEPGGSLRETGDSVPVPLGRILWPAAHLSVRSPSARMFLLSVLGPQWQVIISDVTEGSAGNGERLAYLYDSERVQASGLVGEIVLPPVGGDPAPRCSATFWLAPSHGLRPTFRYPDVSFRCRPDRIRRKYGASAEDC